MDYETFNPHEKAGDYYRRGGRHIRTGPDGIPPSYNFPEDMLVRDLIEDGIYTLPVLRASTESIERIVRQDAQVKRIPTRTETEKRDRIFGGPEQAEAWDMIEEVARWVLYTDAEGYDIAGARIQQLGSNEARVTVHYWLSANRDAAVGILETLTVNFPELRSIVDALVKKPAEPGAEDAPKIGAPRLADLDDVQAADKKNKLRKYLHMILRSRDPLKKSIAADQVGLARTTLDRYRRTWPEIEAEVKQELRAHKVRIA